MAHLDYIQRPQSYGFCPMGFLTTNIAELTTDITMSGYTSPASEGIRIGMAAMIGDEIVVVNDRDGNDLVIGRGCCDTIPAQHHTGDPIWFFDDSIARDTTEYAGTEIIGVKVLPRIITGGGTVPVQNSPPEQVNFNFRFMRPYPPGKLEVNGQPWFTTGVVLSGSEPMVLTWAHRDRVGQQDQLVDHLQDDIGPEAGTTYIVRIYDARGDEDGSIIHTESGIIGTTWTYNWSDAIVHFDETVGVYPGYMKVWALRDGMESLQPYRIDFDLLANPPVGIATEVDTALALSLAISGPVGLATETDTALLLNVAGFVGLAIESDTALALEGTQFGLGFNLGEFLGGTP